MPLAPSSSTVITGFDNAPAFARGLVRDLRLRWALEEIDRPYRVELMDAFAPRPDGYRNWQPFGQVPAFDDGRVRLFETGAILLYLGEQDERLLPTAGQARWDAIAWSFAALNSVEPLLMQLVSIDVFNAGKPWTAEARPGVETLARSRLAGVEPVLAAREWLAGNAFSIADILMVSVLRNLRHTDIVADYPHLSAYAARGEARPAFMRALDDQLAGLGQPAEAGA